MQLSRIGQEKITLMNSPLESKYCCLANLCQFLAANSFKNSEKYTRKTETEIECYRRMLSQWKEMEGRLRVMIAKDRTAVNDD